MVVRALVLVSILLCSAAYADRFDVQIGAFTNPDVAKIVLPDNVGELRSISGPDGLTRFVVGPFASRADAEAARDRLRGSGFGGAFVRASEDLRTAVRQSAANDADTEGEVVMLDGRLHRKVGSQFVPLGDK